MKNIDLLLKASPLHGPSKALDGQCGHVEALSRKTAHTPVICGDSRDAIIKNLHGLEKSDANPTKQFYRDRLS